MHRFGFWLLLTAALMIGTPLIAAGDVDVSGQVGVVNIGDGGGTHALLGGGGSAMVSNHIAILGEFNYVPMGDFGMPSPGFDLSSHILLAGGGVRVYLPVESKRLRLYIPAAGGLLRFTAKASASGFTISQSANGGYFGAGLGAEIGRKFGIRPEFRYSRYEISHEGISGGSNVISATVSVFYRFGGK